MSRLGILPLLLLTLPGVVFAAGGKHAAVKSTPRAALILPTNDNVPKTDKVIATLDNDPVTLRDFEEYSLNSGVVPAPVEGTEEFKKLYDEFLLQLLVEREAKALNLTVSEDDINTYINEVKNQNHVDDAQLGEMLKTKGMSLEGYRKQIHEEILRTRLTQQHARSTVNVSDQDIRKELGLGGTNEHSEAVHLWQVFVPLADDGAGEAYKLAESPASSSSEDARNARKSIIDNIQKKSESVEELKSAGGTYFSDLGTVQAEDLQDELRPAVSSLSTGDVSEIVETEKGFYLFGLARVDVGKEELTDDVRERTRRQLLEGKLRTEMEQYITKELPKKYNLEKKL